ncbi:MAG: hypothetical protein V8T48_09850 [Oscillospiraceae bacterium]
MLDFIRIACAVPAVGVGDTENAEDICAYIEKADGERADIVLFPELALTGYSCWVFVSGHPGREFSRVSGKLPVTRRITPM